MEGMIYFMANDVTVPEFVQALRLVYEHGVEILVYDCIVKEDEIHIGKKLDYIIK